ncbi:AsmA family protein [Candidatus Pelagibacter sp.]|nr:AsmA family protein [Candidatus Pelagibacter sp.]
MKQKNTKKIIKYFDSLVEKTLMKLKNKTNIFFDKNSKISNFNKFLITFISLLFVYLFYLSIPTLYNKTWLQNNIEDKLYKEFRIKFSISSDISYRILPSPHFLIKDSKIFRNNSEKENPIADIKNLKVFISQKNLFNKERLKIKFALINNANFLLSRKDFKSLNKSSNFKFSSKKIKINNSNIFFKKKTSETIAIIKISKAFLVFDEEKLLNFFDLRGEAFNVPFAFNLNVPFEFDLEKNFYFSKSKKINISARKLKLNIFNESKKNNEDLIVGKNIISILNSKIHSKYDIKKNSIIFESTESKIKNSKINYKGKLSINPFDFKFDMNIENYELSKLLNPNSIFAEFIKTKLLFNDNISVNSSFVINSFNSKEKIFDSGTINFNIIDGEINLDKTKFINKKIGQLEINNSRLFFKNKKLTLNTNIFIDIKNSNNLFSFLQTSKQFRKPIKNILINLDYDFSTNQLEFNNLKIDDEDVEDLMLTVIEELNNIDNNNLNKSKRVVNKFLSTYEG